MIKLAGYVHTNKLYQGTDITLSRAIRSDDDLTVLIKYPNSNLPSPHILSGLKNEFAASQELGDCGIIKAISLNRTDNSLALIQEDKGYVLLREFAERNTDLESKLKISIKAIGALCQIHDKGFLHRNICPDSIAVSTDDNEVALTNLQYCTRISEQQSNAGKELSSIKYLAYISPEQSGRISGELDHRSDFYSMGVTLYELFSGQPPFRSTDALELIHSHLAKEPSIPHQLNPDIPESLSEVILKLMAKAPEDRYQSGHGIIQDLKACLKILKKNSPHAEFKAGKQDISNTFTLSSQLVGRSDELARLRAAYSRAARGNCELVIIRGEPGAGKTSLVDVISRHIIKERGEFISGRFDQFQRNRPYSAIIQAFRKILRKKLSGPMPMIEAWRNRIKEALGPNAGIIADVIPEIEELIGTQRNPQDIPAAESRDRFNRTFKNFIKAFPSLDRPLAVFLDDMQWADGSTAQLIKGLLEDEETSHLMLIGAYRTEQNMDNSFLESMSELEELNSSVETIRLDKLTMQQVHQFVSRSLHANKTRTEGLSRLVYTRTGGNPLFVREYMYNLHRSGHISFNSSKTRWEWDLNSIVEISIDGNIVDLMVDKIKSQPPEGQDILKAASCIGGRFDIRLLFAVVDIPEQLGVDYLVMAVREGLLVPGGDYNPGLAEMERTPQKPYHLCFMHDRVQQAAYSMNSALERERIHLSIGRAMLDIYSENEFKENIFEIATQYNQCLNLLETLQERAKVAEILAAAGRKSKKSSAFGVAANYFSHAVKLLDEDCWKKQRSFTFNLYLDWFESDFLSDSTARSEATFTQILDKAETRNEQAKAIIIKMQLYLDQSRYHESVRMGLEMLEQYGISLPLAPEKSMLWIELVKTRLAIGKKTTGALLKLPEMSDPDHEQTIRLLMNTIAPAYMFSKELVFLMILHIIRLSIKHGNAPASAYGYMFYAMFLAARDSNFEKSKQFSELAIKLSKHFNNEGLETRISLIRGAMHDHWHLPLEQNIRVLEEAYKTGLNHGEKSYTSYCAYFIVYYKFIQGVSLPDVYGTAEKFSRFIHQNKAPLGSQHLKTAMQMCKSLEGKTFSPGYLDDDTFHEAQLINMAKSSGSEVLEHWTRVSKIITLSFFRHNTKALEYIDDLHERIETTMSGLFLVPVFHFFSIINMTAVYRDLPRDKQNIYIKRIRSSLSKLEKWNSNCPENFKHFLTIAKAEYSRLSGKMNEALHLYEKAIRNCNRINANSFAGLACEIAADFHFSIGGKRSGLALLSEACFHYEKWGASAKVQRIRQTCSHIQNSMEFYSGEFEAESRTQAGSKGQSLDISAVVKASQAISGEIVLDRLLDKLMRIVIENAGAQKATLLLFNKNRLDLAAHAFMSEHGINTRINPEQTNDLYCKSIVNYILRSKDNILLRDAGTQGPFTIDSYIIRFKPKSILAMPVINQQIMRGVLYLENNLSPGVFTEDRLELLNLICSQAGISIQNARLYSDLRDSETQHRTLLESINVGAFRGEADYEVKLTSGNRALAEMFGFRNWAEFKATPLRSLFIEPRMHERLLEELMSGKTVRDREVNMRRRDGTPIWVNMTASMQHEGSERKAFIDGVLEDITEKRKARELEKAKVAADAANKAKSDFLASMSHEIRTPMNAILGMADMLWESKLDKAQRKYVKLFKNAGENLLLLINDILDLSKIEAGQINLEEIDFNIEELFGEIASIFALRAQLKQIELCWYIHPEVPKIITGDPTRLRQVIVNLVGNSIKFTEKGTISYEAAMTETGLLRFIIKDSGTGIPEEKQNSIFETFSQADSSTTRNYGGTGLGLSICTRMVESMNGGIFVCSEEGKGATFAFIIQSGFPIQPEIHPPLQETIILLVDHDSMSRTFLAQSLMDLGSQVITAGKLEEAVLQAKQLNEMESREKVLIVGTPAGDHDCFEAAKELKQGPCNKWKSLIIIDSKPQPESTSRVKQVGASYVHRPVHPLAVVEEIKYASAYCMLEESAEAVTPEENENLILPKDGHGMKSSPEPKKIEEKTILLVEDSEDNRIVVNLFLKKAPYQLEHAENGREGVDKFIGGDFDLILMDIQMPVMDGYAATQAIREYEQENGLGETPILALTANAFQEDEQKCLACGCNGHLAKPIKKKKLLNAIAEYLDPIQ